jgi:hypothetical protein
MPYEEYIGWQAYFSIYPFTQDREDWRNARVVTSIRNMQNRWLKKPEKVEDNLPDFLADPVALSLERQRRADIEFGNKLREMQSYAKN